MRKIYTLALIGFTLTVNAQETNPSTIIFNGCHNLFEDVNYVLTNTETKNNKKIYITTPVDGDQPCGGLGICEFKIEWNSTLSRWEFLADSGDGDFVNPYVIYYTTKGDPNSKNPPSIDIGKWEENIIVTENNCGGPLTNINATFTGDVNTDSTLATNAPHNAIMQLYPNPVIDYITISGLRNGDSYIIYNSSGQVVRQNKYQSKLDVRALYSGYYIYIVKTTDGKQHQFKFIKK